MMELMKYLELNDRKTLPKKTCGMPAGLKFTFIKTM